MESSIENEDVVLPCMIVTEHARYYELKNQKSKKNSKPTYMNSI